MARTDERRPGGLGAALLVVIAATIVSVTQPSDFPIVRGLVYAPAGRRRRFMVVVERCVRCQLMHHHWSWLLPKRVMYRRCGGRRYGIAPTVVRTVGKRPAVMTHVRR